MIVSDDRSLDEVCSKPITPTGNKVVAWNNDDYDDDHDQ